MSISIGALVLMAVSSSGQDDKIETLQKLVHELREDVSELKNQKNETWLNQKRAEEIRLLVFDVLEDADTRANMAGDGILAGYDGGAYLMSLDENWKLKINGVVQARWLYNNADRQTSQRGFELRRSKVIFSGSIFNPSWTYKLTTTWGQAGGSNTEDAWIAKSYDNGQWIKAGQFKAWFLRENIISSTKQLAVNSSMVQNAFAYGWVQGVSTGWNDENLNVFFQYLDGPWSSNTAALTATTDAWIARAEFKFGEASWGDFGYLTSKIGAKDGLLIGVGYENYNTDIVGGLPYGNAQANESSGWTIDATWRGDGWNLFGYVVETTGKNTTTNVEQDSLGWLIQGGVMVNNNYELFAQYQHGEINDAAFASGSNEMSAVRIGINYWPVAGSNNLKWTTDVAWSNDSLADGAANAGIGSADWTGIGNGWRSDILNNDGQMLLRTQLQLLF
jgi:hypothetical protein